MGCDIHQYAEIRKEGKWIAEQASNAKHTPAGEPGEYEQVYDVDTVEMPDSGDRSRNYGLFGLLSEGVRYDTEHAFKAKGEPEDASDEVTMLMEQWDGDGHSHSYLTFTELKEKLAELLIQSGQDVQQLVTRLSHWIEAFGPNPEGVSDNDRRVVFWFDN